MSKLLSQMLHVLTVAFVTTHFRHSWSSLSSLRTSLYYWGNGHVEGTVWCGRLFDQRIVLLRETVRWKEHLCVVGSAVDECGLQKRWSSDRHFEKNIQRPEKSISLSHYNSCLLATQHPSSLHLTTSVLICRFTYPCRERYIGRSMCVLSVGLEEFYPIRLGKCNSGSIESAIIEHMLSALVAQYTRRTQSKSK